MGFGEVNKLHTGSRGGDNYETVNEETPVTKASMCHLLLNLQDLCERLLVYLLYNK